MNMMLKVLAVVVLIYMGIVLVAYTKQGTLWCGALPDNVFGSNYRAACWNGSLFR